MSRDDSISIELQETAGRDYCAQHGYEVVAVEVDEGLSGRNWSRRPAVQRVMDMVESKAADVIVLWKWSRLSRNRKDWAIAADRVDLAGGRIESATEPIDTATASGRFARGVMTEYAAFQSEQIGEQWQEVFARRAKLGLPPTGALPWGWENTPDGITISDENANAIRHMYHLYSEGRGLVYIANWMNDQGHRSKRGKIWHFASIRTCLESPFHAGYVVYNGVKYDGAHTPIISRHEYDRFMEARQDRATVKKPRLSPYLLSTIVVCHCGRKRVGGVSGRRNRSYVCISAERHLRKTRICKPVDELVSGWVTSIDVPSLRDNAPAPVDTKLLSAEIESVERGILALNTHLALERITPEEHQATRDSMREQLDDLRQQLEVAAKADRNTALAYLDGKESLIRSWPALTVEEQQGLLRSLVKYVRIMPDDTLELQPRWNSPVVVLGSS
ncbi:recombinase family protein [Leucobacter sp. CSA1]|uniref:Recombinase family protein n=1 Tax=Leucobacter chromiisoli TaxID=2796471 RepID=A0A934UVY4_9MICO|nr:recombinase family protein [Leucobacter chromiisoli]